MSKKKGIVFGDGFFKTVTCWAGFTQSFSRGTQAFQLSLSQYPLSSMAKPHVPEEFGV